MECSWEGGFYPPSARSDHSEAASDDLLATEGIASTLTAGQVITQRQRKLFLVFNIRLCIIMTLWLDESIAAVVRKLLTGPQLRSAFPDTGTQDLTASSSKSMDQVFVANDQFGR
jgi:hypothetical protein